MSEAWAETTGYRQTSPATSAPSQRSTSFANSAPQRSAINPAIADLIGTLALRFPPGRDDSPAETSARLKLLMEDVSDALDSVACAAGIKAGVRVWRFLPTCAEICEQASDFLAERRADNRRAHPEPQVALPPPDPLCRDMLDAALAEMRAKLDAGHHALMGTTDTTRPRRIIPPGPQRNPTDADYAELAAIMSSRRAA